MMALNVGMCLILMNENRTFKILSSHNLDDVHLSLLGP